MPKAQYLYILLLLLSGPAAAMTEKQQLDGLEAIQEWDAAYPLAFKLAQQGGSFDDWYRVAERYQTVDQNGLAYLKTWRLAEQSRREDNYRRFAKLTPKPPTVSLAPAAVHRLFQAIDAHPDVDAYARFIQDFPNYPESLAALIRVHGLLYAKAKAANTPEAYDRYAAAFPEAEQAKDAEAAALRIEKDQLARALTGVDPKQREDGLNRVANQLLTAALQEEHAAADPAQTYRRLAAERKFRLLQETPEFNGTHALINALLRAEDIQRFQALSAQIHSEGTQTRQQIEQARLALVETVTEQAKALKQQITVQGQTLQAALEAYNQATDRRLDAIDNGLGQLKTGLDDARRQLVAQQNASVCDGWTCALSVAADFLPGGAYAKFGAAMLAKIPAIHQFLR
jgi:hypothetical protein